MLTVGSDSSINIDAKNDGVNIFEVNVELTDGTITFEPETNKFTVSQGTKAISPASSSAKLLASSADDDYTTILEGILDITSGRLEAKRVESGTCPQF